jgi:hypothetical protein
MRYRFKRFPRYSDTPSTPRYFLYVKIVFLPILDITLTILKISLYNNISKIHYNWVKEDFTRFLSFTHPSTSSKKIYYLIFWQIRTSIKSIICIWHITRIIYLSRFYNFYYNFLPSPIFSIIWSRNNTLLLTSIYRFKRRNHYERYFNRKGAINLAPTSSI